MRDLLDQIEQSLRRNLYYVALYTSLSIPDICGALESSTGIATKPKYIKWFDSYVAHKYSGFITGDDCWYFRCSLIHQGSSQHEKSKYSRILFIEPQATKAILHNNIINDALNIDVNIFCMDIIKGAKDWLKKNESTELYKNNYKKFMKRYPNGLPPYIGGVPVIG